MSSTTEETIWQGHPSHALNFWLNLSCLLVIPIPFALWRWLITRATVYEVTTQRLRVTTGLFSKRVDELELYRVRDLTFVQPFLLRLFGRGNVVLTTSDSTTPRLSLLGVPADPDLRNRLRRAIEDCRDRKRARVAELGGAVDVDEESGTAAA